MAITMVDKVKINKYLKEHNVSNIYYAEMCDILGKKGKISDMEFLEYFTDTVINEFRKNEKISTNYLTKIILFIGNFLRWMDEEKNEVNEDVLDKIRNFENFYDDYLNRTGYDIDIDFTDKVIGSVLHTINELYPSEIKIENTTKYINKINELEEQIKEIKKDFSEINRLYENLQVSYNKKTDKLDSLNEEFTSLEKDYRNQNQEITRLNNIIALLKEEKSELENIISKEQEENIELKSYKERYEKMSIELEQLLNKIEAENTIKINAQKSKDKQIELEKIIYQKILLENTTIDELLTHINDEGYETSKEEIFNLLKKIKTKINIDSSIFSLTPTYKIVEPKITIGKEFVLNIPKGTKSYDIMLVSDLHIKEIDENNLKDLDTLNDYCVKRGINLILNLGDFYHGVSGLSSDYEMAVKNYEILEKSMLLLPKVDGVYHAILGGNHDKNIIKYGYDPINILSEEREDIINLGYTHATIVLNDEKTERFDIHHPDNYRIQINMANEGFDTSKIDDYLNELYSNQGRIRQDSYIDIFGHTHKNQFNHYDAYCYITAFCQKYINRGACHLKIYFDEKSKINYMIFMPLSFNNNELVKNNEIIYKKILTK